MWQLLFTLLALQDPSIPADTPLLADSPSAATVEFSLACPVAAHRAFSNGTVTYEVWRGDVTNPSLRIIKTFRWASRNPDALKWSVRLPPGVYSYEVIGQNGGGRQPLDFVCSTYQYVAALPRATRRVVDTMEEGLGDPIPRVYIYGLAPRASKISVVRFLNNVSCGASIATAAEKPIDVKRDAIGYYASDHYSEKAEAGAVFGIYVQTAGGARTFRAVADYPKEMLVPPTSVRLDLTQGMLAAALNKPTGSLLCVPSNPLGRSGIHSQDRAAQPG